MLEIRHLEHRAPQVSVNQVNVYDPDLLDYPTSRRSQTHLGRQTVPETSKRMVSKETLCKSECWDFGLLD